MEKNKNNKFLITSDGLSKLKIELSELTTVKRSAIAHRIQSARELGDITENSEYESALEEQAFIEGRITELQEVIKRSQVVESVLTQKSEVTVGSRVRLHIEGQTHEFEIVGEMEANPSQHLISHQSPLGQARMGKKVGDRVKVDAPVGVITYTVLGIS